MANDRRRQRIAAGEELVDVDRLAALDAIDQREVGRREQAEVVGVLAIDPLEASAMTSRTPAERSATTLCSRDDPLP